MKSQSTRKLAFGLAALLSASIMLSACGQTSGGNTDTADTVTETSAVDTTPAETKRTDISDGLTTKDFNGREFNIISRTNFTYEFSADEQNGETINDAVYTRNRNVEERFNVEIITHAYGEGNMANIEDLLKPSVLAADDAYQLGAGYTYRLAPASVEGLYVNWNDVPNVDLSREWWSQSFIEAASVNGRTYVATGDLSLLYNQVVLAYFFNKQVATDFQIPNLYDTVKNGEWTLDKLSEYCKKVSSDVNGDGILDDTDRIGLGVNDNTHLDAFLFAFNSPVTVYDKDGKPTIGIKSEKATNIMERLYTLLLESGDALVNNDPTNALPDNVFETNRALFMSAWLSQSEALRNMDADFGIIPYPKWDEAQENYATYYLDRATSFVIPITADLEFVGTITEAMAAESWKHVTPAFYETALKTKYARDDESQEMIDIILSNVKCDFINIYGYALSSPVQIIRKCIQNKTSNLASTYAQSESTYETKLEALIAKFYD